ncbi:branched-chain amino acid ABC transporter permease [Azorhizobium doebereinerae]|uniref:branched-chain amino acid ABC transporter permease n=1 Tax=Azorhizobium doebereinerae TaxID=281091 RepID=UPI000417F896|nr:branched-chain amino acid ABC transporter permease [Azorhizobium doebereinerae]
MPDLRKWLAALVVAVLAVLPMLSGSFLLYSLSLCFANAIAVLSVSVLVRYGGEVSIGHSFFVALGAYTVAVMEKHLGLGLWISLPVALLMGFAAGLLFAVPSRRMSGIYLAVASMALALSLPELLIHMERWTGGFEGLYISRDLLPGVAKAGQRYYFALAALILVCLAMAHFRGSRQGMALLLARAHPRAAEAFGITRSWARISVFALSATLASLSGAVVAFASSTVSPNSFTLWSGIFYLVGSVVSLQGTSLLAALVGGGIITLVPQYLAGAGDYVPILYGSALLIVTLLANSGSGLRRLLPGKGA